MPRIAPSGLPDPLAQTSTARCLVMGVLNVTPDSFSDGGLWLDPEQAVAHGVALRASGADIVDVGGESTRPGADRTPADEELRRVLPVVAGLVSAGVVVSIDTMRAEVARSAVAAGAALVNDVSGGLADHEMLPAVAELGVPVVLMHSRGPSRWMHERDQYGDVVKEVIQFLHSRVSAALHAGVQDDFIVVDPGLGFAKRSEHNWELLAALPELTAIGRPVLIGASRKRFLNELLEGRPLDERDDATDAVSALAAAAGAWCVRVHDVRGSIDAALVAAAWSGGSDGR